MNLANLLDPLNPRMALVWSFANSQIHFTRRNRRLWNELLCVDVADICGKLIEEIVGLRKQMDHQAYFRSSMVTSGALRLLRKQIDILLDDTKKLLETMRREKKSLESLEENLDHIVPPAKGIQLGAQEQLFDLGLEAEGPVITTLPATCASAARKQQIKLSFLEGIIDWTQGPPRARMQEITLLDADVPPSTAYLAELDRLRVLEGSFEGPTLVDWEEELSREGSPQLHEQRVDESITEAPLDTITPVKTQEPTLTNIVVDEAVDVLPPVVEDLEAPAVPQAQGSPQASEEQPSQIELAPLEGGPQDEALVRRARRVRPVMDSSIYLSNDYFKMQMKFSDTLRCTQVFEDIVDVSKLKLEKSDFFGPKPLHRGVLADTLLRLFRPCDGEATFPDPEPFQPEIARHASHIEERDLSAVPSLLQDTSGDSLQRSRSTLGEAPTGLFEEAPLPLQPIEEHEVPSTIAPPPPPPAGDRLPSAKEKAPQKTKPARKDQDADAGRTVQPTRDSDARKQIPSEASAQDTREEVLPGLEGEELNLSHLYEQSFAEPEALSRMVLDYLAAHQEAFFNNLLPQDPADRDAGHLFDLLLKMYKDNIVRLLQDHVFGPIIVTMAQAAEF